MAQSMTGKPALAIALDPALTPDLITPDHLARLSTLCDLLSPEPLTGYGDGDALALLPRVEILLTGWGAPRIGPAELALAPRLRLIAHTGSAVKPVAASEVWQAGIAVTSAAAANAVPVAEFALAAILFANKGVFAARERYVRERMPWMAQWMAPGQPGNCGASVGVVGASRTGRRLLELLRPFDLSLLVCDPYLGEAEAAQKGWEKLPLDRLLDRADTVSLNAPVLPETFHMIGRRELALMRDGATLVNTARGSLVDPVALEAELLSGRLNAVLDVTEPEPLPADSPLFGLPNIFLTPHVAGAAGFETRRMTELAIEEIERFVRGEPLRHAVTADMLPRIA